MMLASFSRKMCRIPLGKVIKRRERRFVEIRRALQHVQAERTQQRSRKSQKRGRTTI